MAVGLLGAILVTLGVVRSGGSAPANAPLSASAASRPSDAGVPASGPSGAKAAATQDTGPAPEGPFLFFDRDGFAARARSSWGIYIDAFHVLDWRESAKEIRRSSQRAPVGEVTVFMCGGPQDNVIEAFSNLADRKSTRLNSSHVTVSRMPSSA